MKPGVIVSGGEIHIATTGATALEDIFTHPVILKDGSFAVVFRGFGSELYQRHYNADGTPKGAVQLITTAPGTAASEPDIVTLKGGGYMVYWKQSGASGSEIEAQMFDKHGVVQGGVIAGTSGTTNLDNADAIQLKDGSLLLSWTEFALGTGFSPKGAVCERGRYTEWR